MKAVSGKMWVVRCCIQQHRATVDTERTLYMVLQSRPTVDLQSVTDLLWVTVMPDVSCSIFHAASLAGSHRLC